MNRLIRNLLDRLPYVRDLKEQGRLQGVYPAGHYHSPIPSMEEVRTHLSQRCPADTELPGMRMNGPSQYAMLIDYAGFYKDLPFPEKQSPGHRYYYDNRWFSYSDAIFLYCFLRKHLPKRIIEVGSGFSSAVMLDTIDGFFPHRPDMTFIDPSPDRLHGLMKESDRGLVRLIDNKIQDVPLDIFSSLQPGDLLFIDSSHVVKCGSDVHVLLFDVLPRLNPAVFVHFHDVFYPFDYPSEWLIEGRYWNENYFLRAFLSWNTEWHIRFFNTYVHCMFGDFIRETMPLCARNAGGSLYIQRAGECQDSNTA
jgi:hypothetical protein